MTDPILRTMLDAIGIEWYVRKDLDVVDISVPQSQSSLQTQSSTNTSNSRQPEQSNVTSDGETAVSSMSHSRDSEPSVAKLIRGIGLDSAPQPVAAEPLVSESAVERSQADSDAEPVPAAFNWLVAECGRILFVADIKQQTLSGVWHSAALEMLNDIAIAMDQKQVITSRYFNWPIMMPNGQPFADVDLNGFLSAFLEHRAERPLILLMGQTAYTLGKAFVADNCQCVKSPTLGELFNKPEAKRSLWQQLKPLR